MMNGSIVYRFFMSIGNGIMKLLNGSGFVNMFLSDNSVKETVEGSIFYKIYNFIRKLFVRLFHFLRLDKLFEGSIFKMVIIWAGLTAVAAPILPTSLVILLAVSGAASLLLKLFCESKTELKFSPVNKFIYIYAAVYAFSIFTSSDVRGSLYGGMLTVFFVLFAIVIENAMETKTQVKAIIFFLSGAGILVSLYGFYQFMFQSKFGGVWVDQEMFGSISFRVYSTLGNPNVLGEYFLLAVPLAAAGFFITKKLLLKIFYIGAVGAMMLCLVLTYSRGCYIGILVAGAVFLVLLDRRFIILGVFALMALPFVLPETIINRFMSIGDMTDSSTSYRVYIWLGTINMLKDYWLCGVGPGQSAFNKVYPHYGYNEISAPHSHNTFLQIMCDTGIIGIIVFICIIYQYYKALFGGYVREKNFEAKVLMISSMASISGFLVESLTDYTFYNYRVMLMFWIFIGLGLVFVRYSEMKE